jgi:hypothetical protein
MSDAAIDRAYEEELQAAARYLEVWVTYQDGRRIKRRVFLDTPEGRQSAAKNADTWMELPLVKEVVMVPVRGDNRSSEGRDSDATQARAGSPAGESRTSAGPPQKAHCCTPRMIAKPSGRRLCHSLSCPDKPGDPIPIAREHVKGRNWPPYGRVRR